MQLSLATGHALFRDSRLSATYNRLHQCNVLPSIKLDDELIDAGTILHLSVFLIVAIVIRNTDSSNHPHTDANCVSYPGNHQSTSSLPTNAPLPLADLWLKVPQDIKQQMLSPRDRLTTVYNDTFWACFHSGSWGRKELPRPRLSLRRLSGGTMMWKGAWKRPQYWPEWLKPTKTQLHDKAAEAAGSTEAGE